MGGLTIRNQTFAVIIDKDGVEHVKVSELCAPCGLAPNSQRERLRGQSWARGTTIVSRRSDGKNASFLCIPVNRVAMFFATLDASRVNDEFRPTLLAMQDEAADAIDAYYRRGGAIRAEAPLPQLLELRDLINEIIRPEALHDDPIWPARFVRRYESWNGRHWKEGSRHPLSMRSANGFFYKMIFPPPVLDIIKARGLAEGCRYHETVNDAPRGYLKNHLEQATNLAEQCASESEWRARMRRWYRKTKADLQGQASLNV